LIVTSSDYWLSEVLAQAPATHSDGNRKLGEAMTKIDGLKKQSIISVHLWSTKKQ